MIHGNSLRSRERFVQVNCAAIPDDLIESELFGHEKGSFTGATEKQIGKFEQADRGTIFLDEIGDMSMKTQAKVLRVLQEGEVERLGSAQDDQGRRAGHRGDEQGPRGGNRARAFPRGSVLSAGRHSHRRSTASGAAAKTSRALVKHFVDLLGREHNVRPKRSSPAAHRTCCGGTAGRETSASCATPIERLVIMTAGDDDRRRRSAEALRVDRPAASALIMIPEAAAGAAGTLREFKEDAERAFLVEKLRENSWNISKTAEVIGTPRSNLYKKLEQYSIRQETDG